MRWAGTIGSFTLAAALLATPAAAQKGSAAPAVRLHLLSDTQLEAARGGFVWAGMSISFGADLQTVLNGQLALRTLVQVSDGGVITTTLVGNGVTPASLTAPTPGGIAIPATVAGNQVYFSNAGQTAFVQGFANGLQSILLNRANGLTATQTTNATLTLGNYAAYAATLRAQVLGNVLGTQTAGIGR